MYGTDVTLVVVTLAAFHYADFKQCCSYEGHPAVKFCFKHKNMTFLSKFFVLRGVKFPAHGRLVYSDVVQPDCQSMNPTSKKV